MTDIDPNLVAIKEREKKIQEAISSGEPLIDLDLMGGMQFTIQQMQLRSLYGDDKGRIWRLHNGRLHLTFDPRWLPDYPLDIAL